MESVKNKTPENEVYTRPYQASPTGCDESFSMVTPGREAEARSKLVMEFVHETNHVPSWYRLINVQFTES